MNRKVDHDLMVMGLPYRDVITNPIPSTETDGNADVRRRSGNPEGRCNGGSSNEEKKPAPVPVPDNCLFLAINNRYRVCYGYSLLYCTLDRDTDMIYRERANKWLFYIYIYCVRAVI